MIRREEIIGDCRLLLGDCLEILPTLGPVDACVTDPPYGLGDKWQGGKKKWPLNNRDGMSWDAVAFDRCDLLLDAGKDAIIWGGHLFNGLPPSHGWLVWDKIVREFSSGHCEFAWTSLDQPVRAFNFSHGALATEGKKHPTQKPLPLMLWCLGFLPNARAILDPFMGSGTTGVACAKLGRSFIGIEIDEGYFNIAVDRIRKAYAQPDLFVPAPDKPVQETLL
jgi:DNA modification methylase